MSINVDNLRVGRQRLAQVFRYLEALNHHRNPVERHLDNQLWHFWLQNLPDHPSIRIAASNTANTAKPANAGKSKERKAAADAPEEFIFKVRRPSLTSCPALPDNLTLWLEHGWEEPMREPVVRRSQNHIDEKGQTVIVSFESDPSRVHSLQAWQAQRSVWAANEKPARAAMQVFEKLYEIRGRIEREGEKIELVLGEGILSWKRKDGEVYHPVLLQRVQLEFDPAIPEFSLSETETPVEFYSALFQSMPDVEGGILARVRQELEGGKFHPLGKEDTSGWLRSLVAQLSPHGEFNPESAPKSQTDFPLLGRSPVLFLRPRNLGFAVSIQSVLENLSQTETLPSSLMRIVGIEEQARTNADSQKTTTWVDYTQLADVLLSKPANPEQVRIAQKLEEHGSVLVQGPPGTGKTHTIGNLLGHLLAQGKSVLVTSHTTKALKLVRDQVVPQLRPLCVSLLDNDIDSRKELESSVSAIVSRLSEGDAQSLDQQSVSLQDQRTKLIWHYQQLAGEILNAIANEYREIVVGGEAISPSEAARQVYAGLGTVDYIPSPVELGGPLPLSESEIFDLYRTNGAVSATDEAELRGVLPDASHLPSASAFEGLVKERTELSQQNLSCRTDLWDRPSHPEDLKTLESLTEFLLKLSQEINTAQPWQLASMLAGYRGAQQRKSWENLLELVKETWECAAKNEDIVLQHQPKLPAYLSVDEAAAISQELDDHVQSSGLPSFLTLLTRPAWKKFIRASQVIAGEPKLPEHFAALHALAQINLARHRLLSRWKSQMVPLGAPELQNLSLSPEAAASQYSALIKKCLEWFETEWVFTERALAACGFRFKQLLEEQPPDLTKGELARLANLLNGPLPLILASRCNAIRWQRLRQIHAEALAHLEKSGGDKQSTAVTDRLRAAVETYNPLTYRREIDHLNELFARRKDLAQRRELLSKLQPAAPGWASAIRNRLGLHGDARIPDKLREAWLWRQLNDELNNRNRISLSELQAKAIRTAQTIQQVTADLIERKAWAAQIRRTEHNLAQKQALIGWLDVVRKMGKGTGLRVPKLKAEANRLMSRCRNSVPVWIMPMSRVADNFDPRTTRFDVVIVDEASQSDVMGLLALYFGEKSVVVGDHEQVSPSAVGQEADVVQHLIDEHLKDVPNSVLYDGRTSIYDLARQSFGDTIRLIEHFRCVPEIIEFSNQLCYGGEIRPLRDTSKVALKSHVIAHRVSSDLSSKKTNEKEAQEVAALVVAASEQPEYGGKTFGVIALVGDDQHYRIDELLRKHLSEESYKLRHNILCGTPAQFQGDERDVMFLSVVDASNGGVLRMREEPMFRQRFNVAASRARDQMWVVHSLDPRAHLKAGDLRRRLIEHAEEPCKILNELKKLEPVVESLFEKEVASRLVRAGYRVIPQWEVGHYRIDLVVEGNGKKIAIECDGDKYHPIERLPDDMARQAVLERLGWTFIRIRGSQFFREPDVVMSSVLNRLFAFGIEPVGNDAQEQSKEQNRELEERVIRRATELRRKWFEEVSNHDVTDAAVLPLFETSSPSQAAV